MNQANKDQIVSTSEFNTNNSWGFGGAVGTQINYRSGSYARMGSASYRHLPPARFVCFYNSDGDRLLDNDYYGPCRIPKKHLEAITDFIIKSNPSKADFEQFLSSLKDN